VECASKPGQPGSAIYSAEGCSHPSYWWLAACPGKQLKTIADFSSILASNRLSELKPQETFQEVALRD
jgi:hypothetical protein